MGNIFSGSEVIELGIQIEKNGRDFYSTLSRSSKNEESRAVFQRLSQEEEKHIAVFQGILQKSADSDNAWPYSDEYAAYMQALASETVFTRKDTGRQVAAKVKSEKEAFDLGIGFEKDSIIFYEGIKRAVVAYDHKIIDELILQEQGHLRLLSKLKNR